MALIVTVEETNTEIVLADVGRGRTERMGDAGVEKWWC
jgi:hypothetical protein